MFVAELDIVFDSQFDSDTETLQHKLADVGGTSKGLLDTEWTLADNPGRASIRLKIRYLNGCVGSIPAPGTNISGTT